MDYGTLQKQSGQWLLELPDTTEELIAQWVNEAIRWAERKNNFRYMEADATFVTTENTRLLGAKPARWKRTRQDPWLSAEDGGAFEIDWAPSHSEMIRQYGDNSELDDGQPEFILEQPTEFWCYPFPDGRSRYSDGEYRVSVPYWRYSASLVENIDSNWLTENAEEYVLYKTVAKGMFFNRDSRAAGFDQLAMREFKEAKKEDKRGRIPGRFNLSVGRTTYGPSRRPRRPLNRNRWSPD